jgi:hypothetical protein
LVGSNDFIEKKKTNKGNDKEQKAKKDDNNAKKDKKDKKQGIDDGKEKKARICPLKQDRSLDLIADDEFPGFLFLRLSLFANNPPPRTPIVNEMKFEEYIYIKKNRKSKSNFK